MTGTKSFIYRFGEFEVRESEFALIKAGEAVPIEHKAFRALLFLLRNHKNLIPKEKLVDAVWGDTAVADGAVTRCIWLLRRLLGDDFNEPRYIETVTKVGYRFICDVEVIEDVQPDLEPSPNPPPVPPIPPAPPVPPIWKRLLKWLIPVTAVLVVGLAAAAWWYVNRPLPPLRVTGTYPITHDNHGGMIAGTDGARIYFNCDVSSSAVCVVSVSGGEIQKVPLGVGHVWLWDVSPDGSNLLVRALEPSALWTVGVPGGPAHLITKVENTWNQRFSPDGKYIAYSDGRKGQEGLYVMGAMALMCTDLSQ